MTISVAYSAYKPTGVGWLGDIPDHWRVAPAKAFFSERSERSRSGDEHLTPSQKYGVVPQAEYMKITGNRVVLNLSGSENMRHVEPGDYISHLRSFQGGLEFSRIRGKVSAAYTVLSPRADVAGEFFRYLFKSDLYVQALQTTTDQLRDGQSIRYGQFALIALSAPPLDEQRQIAEYLDRETGQIDALIAKQEQLVETLTERRQAVITLAVTQGIDPDVDLKDSGVKWLGLVPSHWITTTMKYLVERGSAAVKPGPFGSDLTAADMSGSDVKVFNQKSVLSGDLTSGEERVSSEKFAALKGFEARAGDVLVTSRGTIGRAVELPTGSEVGVIHPCIIRVRPDRRKLRSSYLIRVLNDTNILRRQFSFASNATTIDVIYATTFREARIAVAPTVLEQNAIEEYLGAETSKIDALIAKAREMTAVLRERRQALISAAVTGKIDVREL